MCDRQSNGAAPQWWRRVQASLICLALGACGSGMAFAQPANDAFASATVLTGSFGNIVGDNFFATAEAGETNHIFFQPATASVWYRWVAPESGRAHFDTFGSTLNTILAAYTGTDLTNLVQIAANDDVSFFSGESAIDFNVDKDQTYYLVVDGSDGNTGNFNLNWNLRPGTNDPNAQTSLLSFSSFFYQVTEDEGLFYRDWADSDENADNPRSVLGALVTVTRQGSPVGRVLVDYYTTTALIPVASNYTEVVMGPMGPVTNRVTVTNMLPSAIEGSDFFPVSGTLVFDHLQTSTNFVVPISGNGGPILSTNIIRRNNRPVYALVGLRNARASAEEDPRLIVPDATYAVSQLNIAQIWDYTNRFSIDRSVYRVDEDDDEVEVTVILPTRPGGGGASVVLETIDNPSDITELFYDFALQAGSDYADVRDRTLPDSVNTDGRPRQINLADYVSFSQRLQFGRDEIAKTVRIPIRNDGDVEFNEDILVILRDPEDDDDYGLLHWMSTITILNDDQPAGALDREWNPDNVVYTPVPLNKTPGANGEVFAVQVQENQKTLIAGDFTAFNGASRSRVARINVDGTLDGTFNPGTGPDGFVNAMALYPQAQFGTNLAGKILVGGAFSSVNNVRRNGIARLNPNGSLDPTFNPGAGFDGVVRSMQLGSDGRIIAAGDFTSYNGVARPGVARLNGDGSLDLAFEPGSGANGIVWAAGVSVTSQSIALDVAQSGAGPDVFSTNFNTLSTSGILTVEFGPACVEDRLTVYYEGLQIFDSGLVNEYGNDPGCNFTNYTGPLTYVIPYGPGTATDLTIFINEGGGNSGTIWSFAARIDNEVSGSKIYLGGEFTEFNGVPRNGVVRLNSDGNVDLTFDPGDGVDGPVLSVFVQQDDKVLLGGQFQTFDFRPRRSLVRLNANGSLDETFRPGEGTDGPVYGIIEQPDGKPVIGGLFTSYDGVRRLGMARLFVDGSLDTGFLDTAYNQFAGLPTLTSVQPLASINSMSMQTNGDFMIGGSFTQVGGNSSYEIVDTNLWIIVASDRSLAPTPVWTRQEKRTRYNVARLIGGLTPGPGNATLAFDEYSVDEHGQSAAITLERVNGRLGNLSASFSTTERGALNGQDYTGAVSPAYWEQGWLVDVPESVGRPGTRFGFLPIIDDLLVEGDELLDLTVLQPFANLYLGGEVIPLGGARGRFQAPLTITDDDFLHGILAFSQPVYSVNENGAEVTLTVIRTNGNAGAVTVDYFTVNGSATAGVNQDYTARQNTLTFAGGQTARTITVPILDNGFIEPDEGFYVVLTNATGGAKFPAGLPTSSEIATVNIIDNDFAPGHINFDLSAFTVLENAGLARIKVTRTGGSVAQVSVRLSTTPGSATPGEDYTPVDTVLTWANGDTLPRFVDIVVSNEVPALVEGPQTVNLILSNPSLPGLIGTIGTATLTIVDDDNYGEFAFSQPVYQGDENGGTAAITVIRTVGVAGTVQVAYEVAVATGSGSAASAGSEFTPATGFLQFGPGETARSFLVTLLDDDVQDGDKVIQLRLTGVNLGVLGSLNAAQLSVVDNESFSGPAGSLDPTFIGSAGPNGDILDMAVQPDGKLIIAGDFTRLNGVTKSRVGRLNIDGSLDGNFNLGPGPNGTVRAMALQPDGKIVLGGFFTSVQGTNRNFLARINPDGTADTYFNPGIGPDNPVLAMALTAEGRVVVGGSFASYNAAPQQRVVMVNSDGSLYLPFNTGTGPNGDVHAVAVQRDGKVLIGGDFTAVNGVLRARIARLNVNGSVDMEFDPGSGANATVRTITVQSDGAILIGGSFGSVNGQPRMRMARLLANGTVDSGFLNGPTQGADGSILDIATQLDGKIIVVGDFTRFNTVTRNRITRLDPDGTTDPSINFGSGTDAFIASVLVQSDRKIVIGGGFLIYNQEPRLRLARLHGGSIAGSGSVEFSRSFFTANERDVETEIFVRRIGGAAGTASVDFLTIPASATESLDYAPTNGVILFPDGEVLQSFKIRLLNDIEVEPDEALLMLLTSTGTELGPQPISTLSIASDDSAVGFQSASFSVNEGVAGGNATITLVRSGFLESRISVDYSISGATAQAGQDFLPVTVTVTFEPGQSVKNVVVPILEDAIIEGGETAVLSLSNPTGGASLSQPAAILQILDNDFGSGEISFERVDFLINEYETNAVITVVRENGFTGLTTVRYTTANLTALAGEDYFPSSGSLTFVDGERSKTFNVPIVPDLVQETNEVVQLQLSDPTGGAVLGAVPVASLIIINNALINGSLNFNTAEFRTNEASVAATITVTRSFGSLGAVSVAYATADISATAGSDYESTGNILSWANGETSAKSFTVNITDDPSVEGEERVLLTLSNPLGGASLGVQPTAVLVIQDNDFGPGLLGFASATYAAAENTGNATIRVTRTLGSTGPVSVRYDTVGGGTAVAGVHYQSKFGTLNFADGETNLTFQIALLDNAVGEGDRTVHLALSQPNTASTNGQIVAAVLTIVEDEEQAGLVDAGFSDQGPNAAVRVALVETNSGKLFIGGEFTRYAGVTRSYLARLNSGGTLDTFFDSGSLLNAPVRSMGLLPDNRVLVGGSFTSVNLNGPSYLARFNADGTFDASFLSGLAGPNNQVFALALQQDGKAIIGGLFTLVNGVNRNHLARLNTDGSIDSSFAHNGGLDGPVRAIQVLSDGRIVVGGDFTIVNGVNRSHVVRLNSNGSLDMAFDPLVGPNESVQALAVQTDGRIVIGGLFTSYAGAPQNYLTRLLSSGALDSSFVLGAGADEAVRAVKLQPDGRIVIAGAFNSYQQIGRRGVARLNADGSLDRTFNTGTGANAPVSSLVIQPDRKIIVAGEFSEFDDLPRNYLTRLHGGNNQGSGVFAFSRATFTATEGQTNALITVKRNFGASNAVSVAFSTSDGTALANTHYYATNGILTFAAGEVTKQFQVRLIDDSIINADRQLSLVLSGPTGNAVLGNIRQASLRLRNDDDGIGFSTANVLVLESVGVAAVTVQRTGLLQGLVTVDYATIGGTALTNLDFISTNGTLTFSNGVASQDILVVVTNDTTVESNESLNLLLSNPTGGALLTQPGVTLTILDDDFAPGELSYTTNNFHAPESAPVAVVTIDRANGVSGSLLLDFSTGGGTAVPGVDYLAVSGTISFADGQNSQSVSIPLLSDALVEGDEFFLFRVTAVAGGAVFSGSQITTVTIQDDEVGPGSLDRTFDPGLGANNFVRSLAVQDDGKIVLGGAFTQYDGTNHNFIVRINVDGSLDPTFNAGLGANALVSSVGLQTDGKVLLGGAFNQVDGRAVNRLARLSSLGAFDLNFNQLAGFNGSVNTLSVHTNNRVAVGGIFSLPIRGVVQLRVDGSIDTTFNPGSGGANGPVHCTVAIPDGRVLVGGSFSEVAGSTRQRVARLNSNGSVDTSFIPPSITNGTVYCMALQPDGRTILVGDFRLAGWSGQIGIVRLNSDGTVDGSFDSGLGANDTVFAVDLQPDGKIFLAGSFTRINGIVRNRFARLLSSGVVDAEFDPGVGANNTVYAAEVLSNDTILIGGNFSEVSGVSRRGVARIIGKVIIPLDIADITMISGQARLIINSEPGLTYVLETSTDFSNWQDILTDTAVTSTLEFIDTNANLYSHRFYRVRKVAP